MVGGLDALKARRFLQPRATPWVRVRGLGSALKVRKARAHLQRAKIDSLWIP
jgi:hypothetical protein